MEGFFKIQRKFFKHWLWDEKRTFSRAEAFLDLLQTAAFTSTSRLIKGHVIEVKSGQLVASVRYLSTRWGWGKDKVSHFLTTLETSSMIRRETRHSQTIITLCNYDRYANGGDSSPDTNKDTDKDSDQTQTRTKKKKVKKVKNNTVETQTIVWSSTDGWSGIIDKDIQDWKDAYPACDIDRQLKAANQWLLSNPSKAKKKLWRRFITGWMARTQEKGGDIASNKPTSPAHHKTEYVKSL